MAITKLFTFIALVKKIYYKLNKYCKKHSKFVKFRALKLLAKKFSFFSKNIKNISKKKIFFKFALLIHKTIHYHILWKTKFIKKIKRQLANNSCLK